MTKFSRRHGYQGGAPAITIREGAPEFFRYEVSTLLMDAFDADTARTLVCRTLRVVPDRTNWSHGNIKSETEALLAKCDWFQVYDVVEAAAAALLAQDGDPFRGAPRKTPNYVKNVNEVLVDCGIGWQLVDGKIITRGDDAFEQTVAHAHQLMNAGLRSTAAGELAEAVKDLSRRPQPDTTGAVQHAVAALECVARDVFGDQKVTLGEILKRQRGTMPTTVVTMLEKVWGFSSEQGRHLREGGEPTQRDARLVVALSAAAIGYLS
jgi:hypothetical protein